MSFGALLAQENSSLRLKGKSKERIDYFNRNQEIKKNKYDIYDLSNVNIEVMHKGKVVKRAITGADGAFVLEFEIAPNSIYDVKYSKSGFYSKLSRFETKNCELGYIYTYEGWDVALRKKVDGLDEPIMLVPFEVYYYDEDEEEFSEDLDYTQNYDKVQQEIYASIEKEVMANSQFKDIRDQGLKDLRAEFMLLASNELERDRREQLKSKKIIADAKAEADDILRAAKDSLQRLIANQSELSEKMVPLVVDNLDVDTSNTTIRPQKELSSINENEILNEENLDQASNNLQNMIDEFELAQKEMQLQLLTAKTYDDSVLIQQRQQELLVREGEIARYSAKIQEANSEIEKKDYLLKTRLWLIYGSLGVLAIIIGFLILVFRLFKQKQKVNGLLEKQNNAIAEINNDIVSSIRYAQRIQTAILPPYEYMSNQLKKDYFVLYKPKDIVSGDFYWMHNRDGKVLLAAVDCTGHGVPGAFMSMIGYNSLNKAIKEYGLTTPSDILNAQNKFVSEALRKSTNKKIRDGMDMALITIDYDSMKLEFAGAYNPVYIIRDGQMTHIKGDNMAIGSYFNDPDRQFNNHEFDLKEGDCVYIFSDGYSDQFGGPDYRKFMSRQMKKVLSEISHESMSMQEKMLWKKHKEWKGDEEQIDDICIIGIRI